MVVGSEALACIRARRLKNGWFLRHERVSLQVAKLALKLHHNED
jgi:hypothetical protein